MFVYPKNYETAKKELQNKIISLKKQQYHIFSSKIELDEFLSIDKITIKSKTEVKNRIILSAGLHGIEGYVGHASIMTFIDYFLPILHDNTEVIILHVINPYGMNNFTRTNKNNVDLNRNFSQNNFTSPHLDYDLMKDSFTSKNMKNRTMSNGAYYTTLLNLIRKHGTKKISDAILFGQKADSKGLYYTGTSYEPETQYIIKEIPKLISNIDQCVWIDLHTGYGPRYQMSIINSQFEIQKTKELSLAISYPLIIGLNENDFYDVEGDILEYIYAVHKKIKSKTNLTALCYEYGTLGSSRINTIESLKALLFENNKRYSNSTKKLDKYIKSLMMEQFLPSEEKWRIKAQKDFIDSTNQILKYNKILK